MTEAVLHIMAITSPDEVEEEPQKLTSLLQSGVTRVHIRKPGWSADKIYALISAIPETYHRRLVLHDHHELSSEFNIGSVHLNSRNPERPDTGCKFTISCHSVQEVHDAFRQTPEPEYVTISPIFDSISKSGYKSSFNIDDLAYRIKGKRIVALGGVTPEKFNILYEKGFFGAALLGYIWGRPFNDALLGIRDALTELNNRKTCCNS